MLTIERDPVALAEREAERLEDLEARDAKLLETAERLNRRAEREIAERDRRKAETVSTLLQDFERRRSAETLEQLLRHQVHLSEDAVAAAAPRLGRQERRALLNGKAKLHRGRLIPIPMGGVVGLGATSFQNSPGGTRGKDWDVDPATFYALTKRNEQLVAQPARASGWDVNSFLDFPLPQVGVLHELSLIFTGTMTITPGTGSFSQGWKWPWGIHRQIALQAGGENSVQFATGNDFRTRIERLYRLPPTGSTGGAGAGTSAGLAIGNLASGANAIKTIMKIPVAHDLRTGLGAIFRQTPDLQLSLHIDPPSMAELIPLTGNATAVWTNVNVNLVETYMTVERNAHGMIVLPDVTRVFQTSVEDAFFSNNGLMRTPIPRLPGVLLAISQVLDQGATVIAPSALTQMRFVFGARQQPVTLLPDRALEINRRNYNGLLHGGNYWTIDGEVDNPARDVWIPTNFTEGALEVDIPSSITPAANSRSHIFFETLVQAQV